MTFKNLIKTIGFSNQTWQRLLDYEVNLVWEGLMGYEAVDWQDLRDDSATPEQWQALDDYIAKQEF